MRRRHAAGPGAGPRDGPNMAHLQRARRRPEAGGRNAMISRLKSLICAVSAVAAMALAADRAAAQIRRADQDRLQHGDDRRPRRQRQVRIAGAEDLGRGRQCQGRPARAPGQAHLLRRPEQSGDGAGHLYEAARYRQGRSPDRPLCDRPDRAGDAHRDPAQQALHRAVGARGEQRVQLSQLFRHDPVRTGSQALLHQGLLRHRHGADAEAADRRDRRRGPGILPQRFRRRPRERARRRD